VKGRRWRWFLHIQTVEITDLGACGDKVSRRITNKCPVFIEGGQKPFPSDSRSGEEVEWKTGNKESVM